MPEKGLDILRDYEILSERRLMIVSNHFCATVLITFVINVFEMHMQSQNKTNSLCLFSYVAARINKWNLTSTSLIHPNNIALLLKDNNVGKDKKKSTDHRSINTFSLPLSEKLP
jgi:hypothetical protein